MTDRRFGISSRLFHDSRLDREHLVHIAAHGFDAVEVVASRGHFDYHDRDAVAALAEWLGDTGLALHAMHAPAAGAAAGDPGRRDEAVAEAAAVLDVARTIPYRFLVVRLDRVAGGTGDGHRSLERIAGHAREVGVQVAVELMPDRQSDAGALASLVEDGLEGLDVGVCLDYGHAHLAGDVADAIETLSGHVVTTHVHDNRGGRDEHLVPFAGTIDWDAALMTTQKVGYDGRFVLEVGGGADPLDVLRRSQAACAALDQRFISF